MTATYPEIEAHVRSKIRELTAGPDAIQADFEDGCLVVQGEATADDADQLCAALRRIPGIDEVENRIRIVEPAYAA